MQFQDIDQLDTTELGIRLKRAREAKGLSQENLALAVNLDQRAISELENGKRRMTVLELAIFAKNLDVSAMYFFGDELNPSDLDSLILKEFHRLPSNKLRKMAIDMIRLLSDTFDDPSSS